MEGRRRLEWALAAAVAPAPIRAKGMGRPAVATALMGDLPEAKAAAEEALALHRTLGDTWRIGDDLHTLGYIAAEGGDMLAARPLFEESVRLLREAGDEDYALWSTRSVGWTYHDTGTSPARARSTRRTSAAPASLGNRAVEATTLGVLGSILVDEGRAPEAFLPSSRRTGCIASCMSLWRSRPTSRGSRRRWPPSVGRKKRWSSACSDRPCVRSSAPGSRGWSVRRGGRSRRRGAAAARGLRERERLTPDAAIAKAIAASGGSSP